MGNWFSARVAIGQWSHWACTAQRYIPSTGWKFCRNPPHPLTDELRVARPGDGVVPFPDARATHGAGLYHAVSRKRRLQDPALRPSPAKSELPLPRKTE
jgi:hypothetical protein